VFGGVEWSEGRLGKGLGRGAREQGGCVCGRIRSGRPPWGGGAGREVGVGAGMAAGVTGTPGRERSGGRDR
jgi:hypothetical protein